MSKDTNQGLTGFAEGHTWKALVAYKVEAGMSRGAAEAWATSNLETGVKIWKEGFAKGDDGDERSLTFAFRALKMWAQAR